jgi:hypothetical protein
VSYERTTLCTLHAAIFALCLAVAGAHASPVGDTLEIDGKAVQEVPVMDDWRQPYDDTGTVRTITGLGEDGDGSSSPHAVVAGPARDDLGL